MRVLAAVICLLLLPAVSWAQVDTSDPAIIGYWPFDDGSGDTATDVVNANNGTLNTPADFDWVEGVMGGAIKANGGGSIDVDPTATDSITDALTVAGWFRIDADSDTGIRKNGSFLLEDQSDAEPVPDGFSFRVWTDQGISPGAYGKTELLQGVWYHIAGTYDGTNVELYVNGQPESENGGLLDASGADWTPQWGGNVPANGNPLQLKFGPESLTGAIDDVVIYNRALSAGEVQALIPEPSSLSLLLLGGLAALGFRRR